MYIHKYILEKLLLFGVQEHSLERKSERAWRGRKRGESKSNTGSKSLIIEKRAQGI
jgi:hypothetical protein